MKFFAIILFVIVFFSKSNAQIHEVIYLDPNIPCKSDFYPGQSIPLNDTCNFKLIDDSLEIYGIACILGCGDHYAEIYNTHYSYLMHGSIIVNIYEELPKGMVDCIGLWHTRCFDFKIPFQDNDSILEINTIKYSKTYILKDKLLSIPPVESEKSCMMYPNPCKDIITIE